MKKNQDQSGDSARLRRQAEERLKRQPTEGGVEKSELELSRLVHELEVHQIELELQNEELRQTRDTAEEVLAQYADLYDFAPVGYLTLSEEGLILKANLFAATLLGVTRGALIQQRIVRFIFSEDQGLFFRFRTDLFETGAPQVCDLRLWKKDRTHFWAHLSALVVLEADRPPCCRVVLSDITGRKRAEEVLREGEAQRRQVILQSAMDGFWLADQEGRLLDVNEIYCRMSGYSMSELLALHVSDLEAGETSDEVVGHMQRIIAQGADRSEFRHRFESRHRRKDGSVYDVEVSILYRLAEGGRFVAFLRDITERKRAEGTLRQSAADLRALTARLNVIREEERAALARELHDNFGQNLTALQIDLMWLDRRMQAAQSGDLAALRDKTAAMVPLVERLLEMTQTLCSGLRLGVLDDLGLVAAIEWQAAEFGKRTGLPCTASLPTEDIVLEPDRALALFRIMQEALTNVIRHAQAKRVAIGLRAAGSEWVLEIRDDGRGFAPDAITGARAVGLLGMRERASLCGGVVDFLSAPGQGTTVRVQMPSACGVRA